MQACIGPEKERRMFSKEQKKGGAGWNCVKLEKVVHLEKSTLFGRNFVPIMYLLCINLCN